LSDLAATGRFTPQKRIQAIADAAARHGLAVVEDDLLVVR
jgi:DNA-binding transcriptional MocR family regulator